MASSIQGTLLLLLLSQRVLGIMAQGNTLSSTEQSSSQSHTISESSSHSLSLGIGATVAVIASSVALVLIIIVLRIIILAVAICKARKAKRIESTDLINENIAYRFVPQQTTNTATEDESVIYDTIPQTMDPSQDTTVKDATTDNVYDYINEQNRTSLHSIQVNESYGMAKCSSQNDASQAESHVYEMEGKSSRQSQGKPTTSQNENSQEDHIYEIEGDFQLYQEPAMSQKSKPPGYKEEVEPYAVAAKERFPLLTIASKTSDRVPATHGASSNVSHPDDQDDEYVAMDGSG